MAAATTATAMPIRNCALHRVPQPFLAPLFFVSFVLLGTMIMLNLFIGIIINNMTDLQKQADLHMRIRQQKDTSIQQEFYSLTTKLEKISEHLYLLENKIVQSNPEQHKK